MPTGVLSGWLQKKGGGRWSTDYRRRWFVLAADGTVRYYKAAGTTEPQGQFSLAGAELCATGEADLEVHTTGRIYYITASSSRDRDTWLGAMRATTDQSGTLSWAAPRAAPPHEPPRPRTLTDLGVPHAAGASLPAAPSPGDDSNSDDEGEPAAATSAPSDGL